MKLTLIAAVAQNGVIGSHNALPWYIPEDLKHFKELSIGKTVLMGKNTFDSVMNRIKKPLPERKNVVVTRQMDWVAPEGVVVYHSLEDALEGLKNEDEVIVAGGAQIYKQLIEMDKVDKMCLTHVHKEIDGDVFFPQIDWSKWKKINEEVHAEFTWSDYIKK